MWKREFLSIANMWQRVLRGRLNRAEPRNVASCSNPSCYRSAWTKCFSGFTSMQMCTHVGNRGTHVLDKGDPKCCSDRGESERRLRRVQISGKVGPECPTLYTEMCACFPPPPHQDHNSPSIYQSEKVFNYTTTCRKELNSFNASFL
jgi:hypothetical protein